jgi:hypothetical protein
MNKIRWHFSSVGKRRAGCHRLGCGYGVEDLEDLRELNAAIARNGNKKLVPWDSAKRLLGLQD